MNFAYRIENVLGSVNMDELISAIEKISQKDWVDYLLIIIPILVSLVAIVISIATARKQNRIALFKMRYKGLMQINSMFRFEEGIYNVDSPEVILAIYDMIYGTNIRGDKNEDSVLALMKAAQQEKSIEEDISVLYFLTSENDNALFGVMYTSFAEIVIAAVDGEVIKESQEKLHLACSEIKESVYDKLLDKIKI